MQRVISVPRLAAFGLWLAVLALPAVAQSVLRPLDRSPNGGLVVVELFTSQGCASCPPADAILRELTRIEGVLPLALHVDYWDYIGWQDTFGSPLFTARQQAYARAAGERMVYTPQMIIAGRERVLGNDPVAIMALIGAHAMRPAPVALEVQRAGDALHIAARSPLPFLRPVAVHLVQFVPEARVAIPLGENAGHVFDYVNVVTGWQTLGEWDGSAPLALDVNGTGDGPAAVILQEPGPGAILAAAELR
ncbi:MAG: DUF1223 domain-containing protein [Rubellimicrobium sp.]|nr:DUF1223 domain-containing protein [Rubellimicrobium sp.]